MLETRTLNLLRQQVDKLGIQLQQQQAALQHTHSVLPQAPPLLNTTLPPPSLLHYFGQNVLMTNNSLVEVMDVLNKPMTNQYTVLQETMRQSQSASKEHYLSNAKSCNGKDSKEFGM